jgi:hypothetical protein
MRRLLTVAVVAAVAGITAVALFDVLRGESPSGQHKGQSEPSETTLSQAQTFPPSLPSWQGVHLRTVRLSRAVGATWEEVRALDSGSYALTARIGLPHGADVDVWFESATGASTIDLLGRGHLRDCRELKDRDVCLTRIDVLQDEAEGWRLIARKVFRGPVVMRLRIVFEKTASA